MGPTSRRRRPMTSPSTQSDSVTVPAEDRSSTSPRAATASSEWISQYVGLSGDQDPFVLKHCHFNKSNYYRSGDWACLRVGSDGSIPSHFTLVPDDHLDARPPHYPSTRLLDYARASHHQLIDTFFEIIHMAYPLLDPGRFAEVSTEPTLLAAMYGLALPYCMTTRHLSCDDINSFVFCALPIEARSPRLDTIEAGLLFLQRHTQKHRAPTTPGLYAEIGLLVGMAYDAGLNVDPTSWDLSATERSRRKRIWWALYMQDKWNALGLGRPSYIHDDDCSVPLLTDVDIPAAAVSAGPLPDVSVRMFVAMAALTQILSAILKIFYTVKAAKEVPLMPMEYLIDWSDFFDARLATFHTEHLVPLGSSTGLVLDPTGTLFLAYQAVHLALLRALMRAMPSSNFTNQALRSRARLAVSNISDLLETLQVTRLRAFWWSPMSRINFAAAGGFMFSMLLSSVAEEDVDYWTAEITRYRRLLELQSLTFDITKLAVARMTVLATMGHGERRESLDGKVNPKQAFCRDFGVQLNTI